MPSEHRLGSAKRSRRVALLKVAQVQSPFGLFDLRIPPYEVDDALEISEQVEWLHRYNCHRPHFALAGQPLISRLRVDNLLSLHSKRSKKPARVSMKGTLAGQEQRLSMNGFFAMALMISTKRLAAGDR
jgi:hypothetical protein